MSNLSKEERIKIRDELLNKFKTIIVKTKTNNYRFSNRNKLIELLNNNNQLNEKYKKYISEFNNEEEALYCILHLDDYSNHICPVCGSISKFYNNKHGYRNGCGNKECVKGMRDENDINEKRKKTNLKKFGKEYNFQTEEFKENLKKTLFERYGNEHYNNREKAKETCISRYGHENPMQCPEIQEKARNTCLIKYGYRFAQQSPIVKEKIIETNIKRYNVKWTLQSPEVKEKGKQTCIIKYGCEYSTQSPIVKEKCKRTCLIRYGCEYAAQSPIVKEKIVNTFIRKYGCKHPSQNQLIKDKTVDTCLQRYGTKYYAQKDVINYDIWNDDNKFKEFIINEYNNKESFLLLNEINGIFNVSTHTIKLRLEELNLLKYFYIQESNLEIDFSIFLKENNIKYTRHYRSALYNKETNAHQEIDFLINENIGIEINDIASHNSLEWKHSNKDKYYHYNKTILAKEYNIRLIHLWEWELRDNDYWNNVLSKWILNLCNDNKVKIGARKCLIKEVSLEEEKEFLNNYHLQGYMKSEKCYGLYNDNNELIQLMSFTKPRYNKNYQWELLRLCTKYGYTIIGGAQKLLKYFIKNNENSTSIISYCSLDKFTGKVYEDLGFKLLKKNEPQITWCNRDMKHFSQSSLNMIGADKLLGTDYGKGTNNKDIAIEKGYIPIYNCGLAVYYYN